MSNESCALPQHQLPPNGSQTLLARRTLTSACAIVALSKLDGASVHRHVDSSEPCLSGNGPLQVPGFTPWWPQ
ncbi:hypothetical protein MTO96_036480 [Rhipicephalus appendiculatus]